MNLQRVALPILLLAYFALGLAYRIVNPLGEAADEVPHFAYVEYLLTHHELPSSEGATLGEARQPPLYYVLGALATFWVPRQDFPAIANPDYILGDPQTPNLLLHTRREAFPYQDTALVWHLLRLLSVVMGAVTVWATWRLALAFFPGEYWLALGSAAFVALLPSFLFLSASVNNDNLVIMLTALSVLQVVSMARGKLQWPQTIRLGILMALSVLAKWSGLIVWPFAGAILLFSALHSRKWKEVVLHLIVSFGIAGAVLAPWAFDNLARYGDPLGWSMALSTTELRLAPMSLSDWWAFFLSLYTSFWGRFGGALQLEMSGIVYGILGAICVAATVGWVEFGRDTFQKRSDSNTRVLFAVFSLFWLLLLASYVRWTITFAGTNQARLIHPGLPLLAIFLIAGLARFFSVRRQAAIIAAVCGLLLLNLSVLTYLQSTFDPPPTSVASLPSLGGKSKPADFADTIRITDYRIDKSHAARGDTLTAEIYWQALKQPQEDYWLLLQL
ncbi:MAG TPA: hypothetical protein VF478_00565, partial [Anaerolineae bacterium]